MTRSAIRRRTVMYPSASGIAAVAVMAAGVWAAGCSAARPDAVETVWLCGDGSVASKAEVAAAREHCAATVESSVTLSSNRSDSVQWGVRMVECMEGEDLHLVQRERSPD